MKQTPLKEIHESLGAKMVPFAGYLMPVEYSGIKDEHTTVRNAVGLFDVSHMGEIWVKGPNSLKFLQKTTSNDVSKLIPGKIQYACFPNGKGGIVDDLLIYMYNNEKYLLVVNASNTDKDWAWLTQNNNNEVVLENASDRMSQLALQGPKAADTLKKLVNQSLNEMKPFTFIVGKVGTINDVIISKTGYTGEQGFELYLHNDQAVNLWKILMEAGADAAIKPIGLGARDTLRLEAGMCLYGNDIDDQTSPIEAGLGWITKPQIKEQLIDRNIYIDQLNLGVKQQLVGIEMIDRGIPRHGYEIFDPHNKKIGVITSGTMSPTLNLGIGMAYISTEMAKRGTEVYIKIREKNLKAKIVQMPFINKRSLS